MIRLLVTSLLLSAAVSAQDTLRVPLAPVPGPGPFNVYATLATTLSGLVVPLL